MPLLPLGMFANVFEPLRGKRIGYVRSQGNVGDLLIEMATYQLFSKFGIQWQVQDPAMPSDVDELVFAGGGNMGGMYPNNAEIRQQTLKLGLPLTILPQSFTSREDLPFKTVYVRERASQRYREEAILAPDLALGLEYESPARPHMHLGIFLRQDKESMSRRRSNRDPIKLCRTPIEYIQLAARYRRIITDRLHFAICGLIAGRDTTLLANSYHKNAAMHETWLADLGCKFAACVKDALPNAA